MATVATLNNANRPDVRAYIGATGSGKGVSIRAHLKQARPTRLLVWDPLAEYSSFARTYSALSSVVRTIDKAGSGPFKVAYSIGDGTDQKKAFALLCQIARRAGDLTFLVEELADVTQPSYAPPAWRRITTMGRHAGIAVIAATQRPALVDKTFLGNATYVRCFTLREDSDQRRMASALSLPLETIKGLQTVEGAQATRIAFVERDFRTGERGEKTIVIKR